MTMVRLCRVLRDRPASTFGVLLEMGLAVLLPVTCLRAQSPPLHFQHAGVLPPGAIGNQRLKQGGPLSGYSQPVEIRAPEGARVSLAQEGAFTVPRLAPVTAGMLIGQVYRFRVTHILDNEGIEVYPTVEVIDRLYPPAGQAWRFPIPVQLTRQELELAANGKLVTRVIYLEDPARAIPHHEISGEQNYFEVPAGQDPLAAADAEGRPVAILRMGGRLPPTDEEDMDAFLYGSPPLEEVEIEEVPIER